MRLLPQWVAALCVLAALLFAALEATHLHAATRNGSGAAPCAICMTAHVNVPAVAPQSLPDLLTVAIVAIVYEVDGKGVPADLHLFIRPPPAA